MDIIYNLIGSAAGAGVVVFIDHLLKMRQSTKCNFQSIISIQLALNQMLGVVILLFEDYIDREDKFLAFYKEDVNIKDPQGIWGKYRHIQLHKFIQTHTNIDLKWDLDQFLSKRSNEKRELLQHLISARTVYQHINSILEIRNSLYDKAHHALLNHKKEHNLINTPDDFFYDKLSETIGPALNVGLRSITDEYIDCIEPAIADIYNAFNKVSIYIKNEFRRHEPLELSIHNNYIEEILELKNSKLAKLPPLFSTGNKALKPVL